MVQLLSVFRRLTGGQLLWCNTLPKAYADQVTGKWRQGYVLHKLPVLRPHVVMQKEVFLQYGACSAAFYSCVSHVSRSNHTPLLLPHRQEWQATDVHLSICDAAALARWCGDMAAYYGP